MPQSKLQMAHVLPELKLPENISKWKAGRNLLFKLSVRGGQIFGWSFCIVPQSQESKNSRKYWFWKIVCELNWMQIFTCNNRGVRFLRDWHFVVTEWFVLIFCFPSADMFTKVKIWRRQNLSRFLVEPNKFCQPACSLSLSKYNYFIPQSRPQD